MEDVDIVGAACWSPKGDWIAVGGRAEGKHGLFKVHFPDDRFQRLDPVDAMNPVWSPDGKMIVFEGPHVGAGAQLIAVTPGGERVESFPSIKVRPFGERLRFLPDGSLVYLKGVDPFQEFWLLDCESGKSRKLTDLDDAQLRTFDVTPDSKTIVFDRRRDNSDIVLIERDVAK
jgi:Tol biopolymer transport system component